MGFFGQAQLEGIAGALGDTRHGLTGTAIEFLLAMCGMRRRHDPARR